MVSLEEYQLLDFGQGRKLEKFGPYILDRISPAADNLARTNPQLWKTASAIYHRRDGHGRQVVVARRIGGHLDVGSAMFSNVTQVHVVWTHWRFSLNR
ncbi:MAG: hypothetical protein R3C28_03625 [Pirellulaceae bacterium]